MNATELPSEPGFVAGLLGDGRPLLSLTGLALMGSGAFALFLAATGAFLPHDVAFLGMDPRELCGVNQCRVVHFMFHDRVAFGGVLLAIGTLYLWLARFPLGRGEAWAWWAFLLSGVTGFGSFLAYLGYGYLDTWHGVATLGLLPCFFLGMAKTFPGRPDWPALIRSGAPLFGPGWRAPARLGRLALLGTGLGQVGAGTVIMVVGMTTVFVPEDLKFLGLDVEALRALNPRLVPLIAHDRAGFGGGLLSCGLLVATIVWKMPAPAPRALWQALAISGACGFGCALGVHYPIGYLNPVHLAPAWAGAMLFATGMILARPSGGGGSGGGPSFRPERVPPLPAVPTHANLDRRRPVWLALSDLFLDTDVSLFRADSTRLLAASAYSLEELETILREDVHPACAFNLRSVAGEWAGFDAEWLEGRILCPRRPWQRWGRYLMLGWTIPVRLPPEWGDWRAEVARLRECPVPFPPPRTRRHRSR